jgi:predicted NACHT family NTPase
MKNLLKDQEIKNDIDQFLKSLDRHPLKYLADNPIFRESKNLYKGLTTSSSLTRIYKYIFKVLLGGEYCYQEFERELGLLSKVAYKFFSTNKPTFRKYKLLLTAQEYVDDCLGMSVLDIFELVNKFSCQGIFSKEDDIYFFSHVSLQEFLTAKYIYENDLSNKCILENIADPRYFNVFIFLVEMLKMKSDHFLAMIYAYYKGSKNPYVKDLLLECKQRAIYVDKAIWQLIEKSL